MGSTDWQTALDHPLLRQIDALVERRSGGRLAVVEGGGREGWVSAPVSVDGKTLGHVAARRGGEGRGEIAELVGLAAHAIAVIARSGGPSTPEAGGDATPPPGALVGRSPAMLDLQRILDKVADSETTVLIQGENGTGKELVARSIHARSRRAARPFLAQNCSALNDNLLDSELFGHRRGAFTGAVADRVGLFEAADGGTFFLDEVGDMSPALQVKLLRVLQEGTFTAVGDTAPRSVDVRILAATHRDLRRMVADGGFREDLYYRINVIHVEVPPLRQRREDLPLLVDHFLARLARLRRSRPRTLGPGCLERLLAHDWPGNVRELENEIERLVVLVGDEEVIEERLLSPALRREPASSAAAPQPLDDALDGVERALILEALHASGWNKTRAAVRLGISRRSLIRKVEKHHLSPPARR